MITGVLCHLISTEFRHLTKLSPLSRMPVLRRLPNKSSGCVESEVGLMKDDSLEIEIGP
jgi:hypothetical protein